MRIFGVTFDSPAYLLALALVPVLVMFFASALRSRRAALVKLLGEDSRERLTAMAGRDRRAIEVALAVLTFALVITALAGPRWGLHKDQVKRTGVDVVVVFDASRSMLAQDVAPSRLERAKREVRGLLDAATGSRIAIVTFAGDARVLCPFTLDHDTAGLFLDDIDPESDHAGGSDLAGALRAAGEALDAASGAGKAVVLLSDGEVPGGGGSSAASAASKLAARGVVVHAIGLGSATGAKIPVLDSNGRPKFFRDSKSQEVVTKLDSGVLAGIAEAGGGDYLDAAATAFPMDELWRKRISQMAKGSTGTQDIENLQPRFQWFLLAALATACGWCLAPLGIAVRKRREARLRKLSWARGATAMLAVVLIPANALGGPRDDGRRGDQLYKEGDFKGAAAAYDASGRSEPSENAAFNLGNARYRAKQFGGAAKSWSDAEKMATTPDARRDAYYNRGLALLHQAPADPALTVDMLQEAIESFDGALGLDPADAEARHNRAIAIAQWVEAQKNAQKGGGAKSKPDDKQQDSSQRSDPQNGDPQQNGDPSNQGDPKNGKDEKGEKGEGGKGSPTPGATPKNGEQEGEPGEEEEINGAEMERIDRLLEQREKEQRRIQRVKAGMHKKEGENDW